jgi:uncharacterized membrane protein
MAFNIFLALIAVIFGWLTYHKQSRILKYIFAAIWILFLPNTIYMITDISHLFEDWIFMENIYKPLLIAEYTLLMIVSVITFLLGTYPLEKTLQLTLKKRKPFSTIIIIAMNFLNAFGMVLGRVQRTNSWDVFLNIRKVISDIIVVLTDSKFLLLFFFFAIICNIIYFSFRNILCKIV